MSVTLYYPEDIIISKKLYVQVDKPYRILWYKRTFRGSKVICRSTKTGRFLNHSIVKVAIDYGTSNAFVIEVYDK